MNTRMLLSLGLSAFVLGGTLVGCTAGSGGLASAGSRAADGKQAALAAKALAKGDAAGAVAFAEAAVAAAPQRADYRVLLGKSYLQVGRFQSARAAFADALTLTPDDGRVALNLTLAQIATGNWQAARATLAAHAATIAPSDRGLALALAGDPAGAVGLLMAAARTPGADAKIRQNLGLSLALAGQWSMARAVAAADISPADVDKRMQDWAAFAQPTQASDQVAALLGVTAQQDDGQPAALALVAPQPATSAAEAVAALPTPPSSQAMSTAPVRQVAVAAAAPTLSVARIVFGPRQEVVQPLPAPLLRAAPSPGKVAFARVVPVRAAPVQRAGDWVVQIGAYDDAAVAHDAWARVSRRHAAFAGHEPQGMMFRGRQGSFYRLSVGGFDRAGADALCRRYRAQGGACFVRRQAGDVMAQWLQRPAMQIAAG